MNLIYRANSWQNDNLHVCRSTLDTISGKKNSYVQRASAHEFSVAHYTGKVTYDVRDMADKNRDFLPPDMVFTKLNTFLFKILIF